MKWRRTCIPITKTSLDYFGGFSAMVETQRYIYATDQYAMGMFFGFIRDHGPHYADGWLGYREGREVPTRYGACPVYGFTTRHDVRHVDSIPEYPPSPRSESVFDMLDVVEMVEGIRYGERYFDATPIQVVRRHDISVYGNYLYYYLPGPRPRLIGDYKAQLVRLIEEYRVCRPPSEEVHTIARFEKLNKTVRVSGGMSHGFFSSIVMLHGYDLPTMMTNGDLSTVLTYGRYSSEEAIEHAIYGIGRQHYAPSLVFTPVLGALRKVTLIGVNWRYTGLFVYGGDACHIFPHALYMYEYGRQWQRYPKRMLVFPGDPHVPHTTRYLKPDGRSLWCVWPRSGPVCVMPYTYVVPGYLGNPAGTYWGGLFRRKLYLRTAIPLRYTRYF